jgi:Fe2+ transport system protein FeoA
MSFECSVSGFEHRLASLGVGTDAVVVRVLGGDDGPAERLAALGVTPGAAIRVLQRFPGFVVQCDETELAVEPAVAHTILVRLR